MRILIAGANRAVVGGAEMYQRDLVSALLDAGHEPALLHERGFLVPPNDPDALAARLRRLQEHTDEAADMGSAARKRVTERFTWPDVGRRCLEIYRS